jgi:hypothetical protein
MGSWIVTRDEVPDPQKLSVKFWQNDELRQDYNTDEFVSAYDGETRTRSPGFRAQFSLSSIEPAQSWKRRRDCCVLLFLGVDWKRKGGSIAIETA